MKVTNDLVNGKSGDVFKSCAFEDNSGAITLVGFSSNLSEIDTTQDPQIIADKIASMKNELQVVQLESGKYKLCKRGNDSWTTVDLGL